MKNTNLKYLICFIVLLCFSGLSCTDEESEDISANLIGTWESTKIIENKTTEETDKYKLTFTNNKAVFQDFQEKIKMEANWSLVGQNLQLSGSYEENILDETIYNSRTISYHVQKINSSQMILDVISDKEVYTIGGTNQTNENNYEKGDYRIYFNKISK
ncbi:MAG: hypothetical protein IKQ46_06720 [Bacteroidales bacterium]|jgi:hypothetical protein|nr:hypothetical protein [Bacteroidales bacterium]